MIIFKKLIIRVVRLPVRNFDPMFFYILALLKSARKSQAYGSYTLHVPIFHTYTLTPLPSVPQFKNRELLVAALWLILIARPRERGNLSDNWVPGHTGP